MNQEIQNYIENINIRYQTGISGEHAYRGDLQTLLEEIAKDILIINEPSRIVCGAPDFILTKRDIPVGYIEAKDLNVDLLSSNYEEQFTRYLSSLDNIIFTDYLDFRLYVDGQFVSSVRIAEIKNGVVIALPENFVVFENLIRNFTLYIGQTIKSPKKLAEMMAGKARMLSDVIEKVLSSREESQENSSLKDQMDAFQKVLINDIDPKEFADIYAQTIAYGMFAARLHDPSLDTFTRQEASEQIPKSNPFLRKLFGYIAGPDIDERIKWIVDSLADVFKATDVSALLHDFGRSTHTHDPIVHFYETFLSEYDPKLRKARGVWYTPEPVVNFIVRAVDDILKSEFGLEQGLADTSKIRVKVEGQGKKVQTEVHRVQILDPAAGTGTFLAEVIRQIYKGFENQQGIWSSYVENHLIPRINGFELLMASYAIAHLKIDMLLSETGYKPTKEQRFRVYLTNSLEEYHPYTGTLFTSWLSQEANEANYIKRDTPVMVVLGNPPYSVSSSNKSDWIENLMADYKKDLGERNIQPLSDDYIKFIRFGHYFVEKNGSGVLAYITNNSFIDGNIHRQMRKELGEFFEKIYIVDLHGNSKKKEVAPDGSSDENVFDIQQGVSISIFIKSSSKRTRGKKSGRVLSTDLFGSRDKKYDFLTNNSLSDIRWKEIAPKEPNYFFKYIEFRDEDTYKQGFKIDELYIKNCIGIATGKDSELVSSYPEMLEEKFLIKPQSYSYRPFDDRYTVFDNKLLQRARFDVMKNMLADNYALQATSKNRQISLGYVFITKNISDRHLLDSAADSMSSFPLYVFSDSKNKLLSDEKSEKKANFNIEIVRKIENNIGLGFSTTKTPDRSSFTPLDVLDYIYAVLHAPSYRNRYKEFLKMDFPRVPYPEKKEVFWELVHFGAELRQLHLLESPLLLKFITSYPIDGFNIIEKVEYDGSKVWVNGSQYFDNVPGLAWYFYIGGYQPSQKWLKDRKGKTLDFEDIQHYQKIIVALVETDKLMQEIDKVITKEYLK